MSLYRYFRPESSSDSSLSLPDPHGPLSEFMSPATVHNESVKEAMTVEVKSSSVSTWKSKYLKEMKRMTRSGEEPIVKCIPLKKRGRPLLIGEKLDAEVILFVLWWSDNNCDYNCSIVRKEDRNILAENGGPITLTKTLAKSLLCRLNFAKRRGSSAAKIMVHNFDEIKQHFLLDIKGIVEMEEILPDLIFNWDQTGISIVQGSNWTMELNVLR